MTTHQDQPTALDEITELLAEHGFDGLAQAVTVLLNEVMKLERSATLGAGPYQRTDGRTGYANGFKPRVIHTRLGPLALQVPQTRGVEFYPSALEKGVRSERALKLAVAEEDAPRPGTWPRSCWPSCRWRCAGGMIPGPRPSAATARPSAPSSPRVGRGPGSTRPPALIE